MFRYFFAVLAALVIFAGCRVTTRTETLRTPSGVTEVKRATGPYSDDTSIVVVSDQAFRDCLRRVAHSMPSVSADAYCRGAMQSGGAMNYGYNPPPFYGGLMPMAPLNPIFYEGMPPRRTLGEVAMDQMPGTVVPMFGYGSSPYSYPSGTSTPSRIDQLQTSELSKQNRRICTLEGQRGKPCIPSVELK